MFENVVYLHKLSCRSQTHLQPVLKGFSLQGRHQGTYSYLFVILSQWLRIYYYSCYTSCHTYLHSKWFLTIRYIWPTQVYSRGWSFCCTKLYDMAYCLRNEHGSVCTVQENCRSLNDLRIKEWEIYDELRSRGRFFVNQVFFPLPSRV